MNNTEKGFTIPNQTQSVSNQLKVRGRGLMIDTYDGTDNGLLLPIMPFHYLVQVN